MFLPRARARKRARERKGMLKLLISLFYLSPDTSRWG
jgi:hypothetical protein